MSSDELFWHNPSANNANVTGFGTLSLWEVPHMWYFPTTECAKFWHIGIICWRVMPKQLIRGHYLVTLHNCIPRPKNNVHVMYSYSRFLIVFLLFSPKIKCFPKSNEAVSSANGIFWWHVKSPGRFFGLQHRSRLSKNFPNIHCSMHIWLGPDLEIWLLDFLSPKW